MPARFPEVDIIEQERQRTPRLAQVNGNGSGNGDARWNSTDDIVISGLSGRLPESNNIEEFKEQLFAGVDLITDDERRWPSGKLSITGV